jgi:hypothetical protein
MGKWTADHHDIVLRAKMKCLVSGAIERHKIEKADKGERAEPAISYQSFVEELDTGDSFTTTLVDILVRELADRRTRVVEDKRSIARSTSTNLRSLASHTRVPWDPSNRRLLRRPSSANLASNYASEFMTESAEVVLFTEDEEDLDNGADSGANPGDATHNPTTELYNAYLADAPHWPVLPRPPRGYGSSHSRLMDDLPPPLSLPSSPPSMNRTTSWNPPLFSHGGASLTRQPSLRRPNIPRPASRNRLPQRMSEFTDFTSSRRSSLRHHYETDPREPSPNRDDVERREALYASYRPRRVVGPSRFRDARPPWDSSEVNEPPAASSSSVSLPSSFTLPWASAIHQLLPTPSSTSSSQDDEEYSGVRHAAARRLRRGGVRPPESILPRPESLPLDLTPSSVPMPPSPISAPVSPPQTALIQPPQNETAEEAPPPPVTQTD